MTETVHPKVFFTWDIHYKCNYNCTYCFLHFEPETANIEAKYLEHEKWISIWENIYKRYGSCHILVTGGEPFTYPNFISLISELSEIHTFEFSTNLSWDIEEFIEKVDVGKVKIESSFHPEFISVEEFLNRVTLLREKDYLISITIVAYPTMLDKIFEYKEKFEKEGITFTIYPYRGPYQDRKYPDEYTESERTILNELTLPIRQKVSKKLLNVHTSKEQREGIAEKKEDISAGVEKMLCLMGYKYAKITPDGNVYRCCAAIQRDWGRLGNIIDGSFALFDEPQYCPDSSACRCFKSMIVGKEEKWERYWKDVCSIRRERDENRDIEIVTVLRDEGKIEEAIKKANEILTKNPNNIRAITLLGELYIAKKDRDERSNLESVKALRDEGKIEEAIKKVNEILTKNPNNIKAITLLGEIYIQKKDFMAAEKTLQTALEKNHNSDINPWIYRALGRLYCELGISYNETEERQKKFSYSLNYLSKAIESATDSIHLVDRIWAYYEIAFVFYNQGNYRLAEENIRIALNYQPKNKYFQELLERIKASIVKIKAF